jgi:hypothetical protein
LEDDEAEDMISLIEVGEEAAGCTIQLLGLNLRA